MPKPISIQFGRDPENPQYGEQIIFHSDYLYKELNDAVKPGGWRSKIKPVGDRTRPGAWVYPAWADTAAKLLEKFDTIIKTETGHTIDPRFFELAAEGRDAGRLKVTVNLDNTGYGAIELKVAYDEALISVFHKITDCRFDRQKEVWSAPATPFHADRIKEVFERNAYFTWNNAKIDPAFDQLLTPTSAPELVSKTEAWAHQLKAYNRAFHMPGFMLALDMGTGKSKVAVDLVVNRKCKRTLVICPKKVINVWPKQFELHAGAPVAVLALKKGASVNKAIKMTEFLEDCGRQNIPAVIVMNYESAWRDDLKQNILNWGFDCVILDESHKIKSPGGKASMFAAELGKITKYRLCLTGTPMPHSPADIYAQYRFLDSSIFGTRFKGYWNRNRTTYFPGFLDKYATSIDDYNRPQGWKNTELNNAIYSIAERVKSTDVLDLPPVQHIEHYFELEAPARKIYNDLDQKFAAMVDDATVSVSNKLTQILRFAQLTSGYITDDDGYMILVDTGKMDLLQEILDDLEPDEPVVVFARFRRDLDTIHEIATILGRKSLEVSGRRDELEQWQNGGAPILAVQIQSGGAGVDCTRACHCIYYSTGYSNGDYEQSLKRVDRPGQTRPVRFYHLLCENSIDIKIQTALASKKSVVESILGLKTEDKEHAESLPD